MNKKLFTFRRSYFIYTIILLCVEIAIAALLHDKIIRPHIGDVLVVMLIYCFLRSFFNISIRVTTIIVFMFACLVESLQYFQLVSFLHLNHSHLAKTIIGSSFSWWDIGAYLTGILIILLAEKRNLLLQK